MASVIDDEIWCCTDCLMLVANDDATGMDDEIEEQCRKGIASFHGYLVCNDNEEDGHDTFSWRGCEVCGSHLGGERFRLALLGE